MPPEIGSPILSKASAIYLLPPLLPVRVRRALHSLISVSTGIIRGLRRDPPPLYLARASRAFAPVSSRLLFVFTSVPWIATVLTVHAASP